MQAVERVRPAVAVFGHVHESRGVEVLEWENGGGTRLVNCASMTKDGKPREGILFEISITLSGVSSEEGYA